MGKYAESEAEKRALYDEYEEEIKKLANSYEAEWGKFKRSWKKRLAKHIDEVETVEAKIPDIPDRHTAVDVKLEAGVTERWILFSWHKRFSSNKTSFTGFIRDGWWKDKETLENSYMIGEDHEWPSYRVQIVLDIDQNDIIKNKSIKFKLVQGAGSGSHQPYFAKEIKSRFDESKYSKPEISLRKEATPIIIKYDIPVDTHETFFDACMSTIAKGFYELVIDKRQFINDIEEVYEKSLNKKELDAGTTVSL